MICSQATSERLASLIASYGLGEDRLYEGARERAAEGAQRRRCANVGTGSGRREGGGGGVAGVM